jgi:uncharacterized protein YjiS (DUF1127 family)
MLRIALPSRPRSGLIAGFGPALRSFPSLVALWRERSRQRRQLMELTERDLRDLRLTRVDVEQEASKPFWKP